MKKYLCPSCGKRFNERKVKIENEGFCYDYGEGSYTQNCRTLHCPYCNGYLSDLNSYDEDYEQEEDLEEESWEDYERN